MVWGVSMDLTLSVFTAECRLQQKQHFFPKLKGQSGIEQQQTRTKMDKAVFDRIRNGYRVFIGDLGSRVGKYEIEREFKNYGTITDTWVAR